MDIFALIYFCVWVVATIVSYVGLFEWRPWGRKLFLQVTIAGVILELFSGASVASSLVNFLNDINNTLAGVIIAMLYLTPLSQRFEKTQVETVECNWSE